MADATIRLTTEGSGPLVDNSIFTAASSSDDTFRQRIVIGGDATSSGFVNPSSAAPSSGDYSIPVRLNAGASSYNIGTVLGSSLSVSTIYSSSSSPHIVLLSTAAGSSYLDPRQATIIAAGSSINVGVVPAGSSTYALGLVYAGSTWPVNILAGGSSINFGVVPAGSSSYIFGQVWATVIAAGSSINVGVVPAGSSTYSLGLVYPASTWAVNVVAGGSSINFGMVAAGSSSYQVGTVFIGGGSTDNTVGSVALLAGTTATMVGTVTLSSASITGGTFVTRTDVYTSTGNGTTVASSLAPLRTYGLQVAGALSVAASMWDVRLEGSLDNINFSQILQHTDVTGDGAVMWSGGSYSPSLYFRSRCVGLTLGTSTAITASILGIA